MHRVRERSMTLRVNRVDRIVSFTGEDLPQTGHSLLVSGGRCGAVDAPHKMAGILPASGGPAAAVQ
jgi:hypothetical protein